jgi:hypothetical protein
VKLALIGVGLVFGVVVVLFVAHYQILVLGNCESPEQHRISRLRGHVVGKSLGPLQYRWLRRNFKAGGTQLAVVQAAPDSHYEGNVINNTTVVAEKTVAANGVFDFGELPPGDYAMWVTLPGQATASFGFSIDAGAPSSEVLIDASPAYYCRCCGWNFEPQ